MFRHYALLHALPDSLRTSLGYIGISSVTLYWLYRFRHVIISATIRYSTFVDSDAISWPFYCLMWNKNFFLFWVVFAYAMTCAWTLTSVHLCFKSAATQDRSETRRCVALTWTRYVCISKHGPKRVCLFIPTFVLTAFCCTSVACLILNLSHFVSLWRACSLRCGHTYAHVCSHTDTKSHKRTLSYKHKGRSARIQPYLCT